MDIQDLRKKMSDWDFSEHTHTVEEFKSANGNTIRVDHLRKGSSNVGYVRFVNDDYGLSVFGDFGNWIFDRPFVPSKDGYVSMPYWNEKLTFKSCQQPAKYDPDETEKELKDLIKKIESNREDYTNPDMLIEFYTDLLDYTDDEIDYTYHAFRYNKPIFIDYEDIPLAKKGSPQLLIVFDAFNEICSRIKYKQNDMNTENLHPLFGDIIDRHAEPLKLKDFDVWYKPCSKCGYDTGKSTIPKNGNKTCWKCGNFVRRDYSERALKKK